MMRPFFTYFGAKWAAAKRYPEPTSGFVVEPFAGAAGYSVHWEVPRVILLDTDPNIVGTWKYLIGVSAAEIRSLPLITAPGSGAYSSEWIWLSQAKSACYECGNDDPAEGWFVCSDCLERAA